MSNCKKEMSKLAQAFASTNEAIIDKQHAVQEPQSAITQAQLPAPVQNISTEDVIARLATGQGCNGILNSIANAALAAYCFLESIECALSGSIGVPCSEEEHDQIANNNILGKVFGGIVHFFRYLTQAEQNVFFEQVMRDDLIRQYNLTNTINVDYWNLANQVLYQLSSLRGGVVQVLFGQANEKCTNFQIARMIYHVTKAMGAKNPVHALKIERRRRHDNKHHDEVWITVAAADVATLLALVHKRVIFDETGFWFAATKQAAKHMHKVDSIARRTRDVRAYCTLWNKFKNQMTWAQFQQYYGDNLCNDHVLDNVANCHFQKRPLRSCTIEVINENKQNHQQAVRDHQGRHVLIATLNHHMHPLDETNGSLSMFFKAQVGAQIEETKNLDADQNEAAQNANDEFDHDDDDNNTNVVATEASNDPFNNFFAEFVPTPLLPHQCAAGHSNLDPAVLSSGGFRTFASHADYIASVTSTQGNLQGNLIEIVGNAFEQVFSALSADDATMDLAANGGAVPLFEFNKKTFFLVDPVTKPESKDQKSQYETTLKNAEASEKQQQQQQQQQQLLQQLLSLQQQQYYQQQYYNQQQQPHVRVGRWN